MPLPRLHIRDFFTTSSQILSRCRGQIQIDVDPEKGRLNDLVSAVLNQAQDEKNLQLNTQSPFAFLRSLAKYQSALVAVIALLATLAATAGLLVPYAIEQLLTHTQQSKNVSINASENLSTVSVILIAITLLILPLISTLIHQYAKWYGEIVAGKIIQFKLTNICYQKMFCENGKKLSVGEASLRLSSDCDVASLFLKDVYAVVNVSVVFIFGTAYLFQLLGTSAFVAIFLLMFALWASRKLSEGFYQWQMMAQKNVESRLSLTAEILNALEIIRTFGWQDVFLGRMNTLRSNEAKYRLLYITRLSLFLLCLSVLNSLVLIFTVGAIFWTTGALNAAVLFSAMAVLRLVNRVISSLPEVADGCLQRFSASQRLCDFLDSSTNDADNRMVTLKMGEAGIDRPQLIDFKFGQSVALVGPVGSGKTHYLSELISQALKFPTEPQTECTENNIYDLACVSQKSFFIPSTIRDNLTLGKIFSENEINTALNLCEFSAEIADMPLGLDTLIDDQATNLSGGQRQRLALARAVLFKPKILFLDAPFSGLDPATRKLINANVLFGALNKVTRIMTLSEPEQLEEFERILIFDAGKIIADGTLDKLLKEDSRASEILKQMLHSPTNNTFIAPLNTSAKELFENISDDPSETKVSDKVTKLTNSNLRTYAALLFKFGKYLPSASGFVIIFVLVLAALLPVISNSWMALITEPNPELANPLIRIFGIPDFLKNGQSKQILLSGILVFALLEILSGFAMFLQIRVWYKRCFTLSVKLHEQIIESLFSSQILKIRSIPIGNILSRLSHDFDQIDNPKKLPTSFFYTVRFAVEIIVTLIFISFIYTPLLFLILFLALAFCYFQAKYRPAAQWLERNNAQCRARMASLIQNTVEGRQEIVVFRREKEFASRLHAQLSQQITFGIWQFMLSSWYAARAPLIAGSLTAGIAIYSYVVSQNGIVNTSDLGLALVLSLGTLNLMDWFVEYSVETGRHIVGFERVTELAQIPKTDSHRENPCGKMDHNLPRTSVCNGSLYINVKPELLSFKNVTVSYESSSEAALQNVSFEIPAGSHVGIYGRTGAGKSTIFKVLLGFMEPTSGEILLGQKPLTALSPAQRSVIFSYVPQVPVVFNESLRFNLDPTGMATEEELLHAIERTHLTPMLKSFPNGLSTMLNDSQLISSGQAQLLSLARVLIKKTPFVLLDEPTSAVDIVTRTKILNILRSEFRDKTLLIIAHQPDLLALLDVHLEVNQAQVYLKQSK